MFKTLTVAAALFSFVSSAALAKDMGETVMDYFMNQVMDNITVNSPELTPFMTTSGAISSVTTCGYDTKSGYEKFMISCMKEGTSTLIKADVELEYFLIEDKYLKTEQCSQVDAFLQGTTLHWQATCKFGEQAVRMSAEMQTISE